MTFEDWLRTEGYAQTSITKLLRDVEVLRTYGTTPPHAKSPRRAEALRWAWRCWADYCKARRRPNRLPEPVPEEPGRGRRRRRAKRLNPAESMPTEEWRRFLAVVEADPRIEARVIDVQCSTALRIGDVLRASRGALTHGFSRSDGVTVLEVKNAKPVVVCLRGAVEREWRRLYEAVEHLPADALVSAAVSPGAADPNDWTANGAAYRKVDRAIKELGAKAGVSGIVHTHRIRRTVAMQAALAGVAKVKIQKLLSHDSDKTTDRYLDEAMAREAASLADVVRGRRDA